MVRQRKIKRKFVSLMLAASLAGSPLTMSPMNVFAGTGKNGVKKAPYNVISIQGDSSYCMKKGNQVELKKTLGEGAEFAVFVSENPDVATVDDDGTVTAVGPGETTIKTTTKLKGSNQIHTATCRVIVTGFIVEVMSIKGADSTVKGTVYSKDCKKVVDGKVSEVGIGDVIEIDASGKVVVKDAVIVQNGGQVTFGGFQSTLNVQKGGALNVYGTLTIAVYGTLNVDGKVNVNSDDVLKVCNSATVNVNSGGILDVYASGTVRIDSPDGTLNVYTSGTLRVQNSCKLYVSENGVLVKQQRGEYTDKKWQGT